MAPEPGLMSIRQRNQEGNFAWASSGRACLFWHSSPVFKCKYNVLSRRGVFPRLPSPPFSSSLPARFAGSHCAPGHANAPADRRWRLRHRRRSHCPRLRNRCPCRSHGIHCRKPPAAGAPLAAAGPSSVCRPLRQPCVLLTIGLRRGRARLRGRSEAAAVDDVNVPMAQ